MVVKCCFNHAISLALNFFLLMVGIYGSANAGVISGEGTELPSLAPGYVVWVQADGFGAGGGFKTADECKSNEVQVRNRYLSALAAGYPAFLRVFPCRYLAKDSYWGHANYMAGSGNQYVANGWRVGVVNIGYGHLAVGRYEAPPPQFNPDKQYNTCDGNGAPAPTVGNPIHAGTGVKQQLEVDVSRTTTSPFLQFVRYYWSTAPVGLMSIGTHWRHTYERRIEVLVGGTAPTEVRVIRHTGNRYIYAKNADGTWASDPDVPFELVRDGDAWLLTDRDGVVEHYSFDGRLMQLASYRGIEITLRYDTESRLHDVRDISGRALLFDYNTKGYLSRLSTADGDIGYSYDAQGNLATVTYPGGAGRLYHYEDSRFPNKLTGITDENNSRYATWAYDERGRAISSEHAGGTERTILAYNSDGTATVTNVLGKQSTYHFELIHGVHKVARIEGHPTVTCAGANQSYTYDANGYLASKTDWNGITTTYVHDAHGRELSRTEAAGTPEARSITTEWHSQWHLPVRITESGKVTTFAYNDKGRVVSQTAQSSP